MYCYWRIVAEADVRVRVRGRIVSVHRQRGQVRVTCVVTATEPTDRPYSAAALFQPHHLTGTPIPLCALVGGMDFCFVDVAPHLHNKPLQHVQGFTLLFQIFAPTALRRYLHPSFQSGPRWSAGFRRRAIALLCFRFLFRDAATGAEADGRERARGRIGSAQRQRGQGRDTCVGTATEPTDRPLSCTCIITREPVILTYIGM